MNSLQNFESQTGLKLDEKIEKGLADCTIYHATDSDGIKLVVKIDTSPRGIAEINDNLFGYNSISELGAATVLPSPIRFIESDLGPALVLPYLGEDYLTTSNTPNSVLTNFIALKRSFGEVYSSVVIQSQEVNIDSLQNILDRISERVKRFFEKGISGYNDCADLSTIDVKGISGKNNSLFILDFTPSNLFIVDKKAIFIDPWKQTTYMGSPLLSLGQFITYAEESYELPGFNNENLQYLDFIQRVGKNLGLSESQTRLQFLIGQTLQYSLSAYYRIESQPEKANRFLKKMRKNIKELREYNT